LFSRLLNGLEDDAGLDYAKHSMLYFLHSQEEISPETLTEKIKEETHSQKLGDTAMSIAEQLLQKGFEDGMLSGIEKGIEKEAQRQTIHQIELCQKLLKLEAPSNQILQEKSLEELKKMQEDLEQKLLSN